MNSGSAWYDQNRNNVAQKFNNKPLIKRLSKDKKILIRKGNTITRRISKLWEKYIKECIDLERVK